MEQLEDTSIMQNLSVTQMVWNGVEIVIGLAELDLTSALAQHQHYLSNIPPPSRGWGWA